MPLIDQIEWRRSGYGFRITGRKSYNRSVQIYQRGGPEGFRCIDRRLSVAAAIRAIRRKEENDADLQHDR